MATIYVADDDPVLRRGLHLALEGRGYVVRTAADGAHLVELLESGRPDVLVLDVMMPRMTGLDVLRWMRGDPRWSDLPVVVVTAYADGKVESAAAERSACDILPKPFRLNELVQRIERWVG